MKVKREKKSEVFQPVQITITFESADEVCDLWHRLNLSVDALTESIDAYACFLYNPQDSDVDSSELWSAIDRIVEERSLRI